ncbi:hypothetical protein [Micromonospora sp. NBC_00421]|uniref:hypothetical protein n=1 Tax=Micromonospora sp. NBC_00421 TaxID=2975976 RepID=UPI002E1D4D73
MTDPTNTDDRWHLNRIKTERGFTILPDIPSQYGGWISVSESSAASGPHVWVRATAPADLNAPNGPMVEAPLHLTADNARRLAEQLLLTVDEHYRADGTDDEAFMPVRPGDVLAAGLNDGRCPVGVVTAVDDDTFRLDLYSWPLGSFTAGTMIVRHDQVREFSPLAVQRADGVFDMDPLAAFQTAWKDANR